MAAEYLIVGAGLYGATVARELTDAGRKCLVIEKRPEIGGNCRTEYNGEAGCHVHLYGPHIFHTDNNEVWDFVNRFARFNNFVNRPKVSHGGKIYSFPVNLFTLYQLFGVRTPEEALKTLENVRIPHPSPRNLEEWCLDKVGPEIYETFIRGYTIKQWRKDPRDLPADIIKRLPVRLTFDDNYYTHPHQGVPVGGYTAMIAKMLEGIPVETGADFLADREMWTRRFPRVICTGQLDAYFDYEKGALEYRSLTFEHETVDAPDYQGNAVINYTEETVPYTRIVEHKHFDPVTERTKTAITREYPADWEPGREPYYPVDTAENRVKLASYQKLAEELRGKITFGGRLGEYRYYDMDKVVEAALNKARELGKG